MPRGSYDVFISYRQQSGAAEARLIRTELVQKNWRVFLDVADLRKGYFDEALLKYIAETPNFIVILSANSLDRCVQEQDWLRQEIAQAIKTGRNIIPVLIPGFKFPSQLPVEIQSLPRYQALDYSHRYFDAMIAEMIRNLEHSRPETEHPAAGRFEQNLAAGEKPIVKPRKGWAGRKGKELPLTLSGHSWPVLSVAWSPDSKWLATGSEDNTAKIWDSMSGEELLTLSGHSLPVWSVAWSPDGKRLVTGSWDETAMLWDPGTKAELLMLRGHGGPVTGVAWCPDGNRLATASQDNTGRWVRRECCMESQWQAPGHGGL